MASDLLADKLKNKKPIEINTEGICPFNETSLSKCKGDRCKNYGGHTSRFTINCLHDIAALIKDSIK